MPDEPSPLLEAAKKYLKSQYGEETVSMTVKENGVDGGNGVLSVDCTVSCSGHRSDWRKDFTFRAGKVTHLSARQK